MSDYDIDPDCAVKMRTLHEPPYWRDGNNPEWQVCARHKHQYETAYDDYSHIDWQPAVTSDGGAE